MGPQARTILSSLEVSTPEALSFTAVKEKLDSHFMHPVNEIYESRRFHRRTQQPSESVDDFFTALRNLVKRCSYNSPLVQDCLVHDRFDVGIRDEKLSDQLCQRTKLTAEEALCQARKHEDAEKERLSRTRLTMDNALAETLNTDSAQQNDTPTPSPRFRDQSEQLARLSCGFCGRQRHSRKDCPARKSVCHYCRKLRHFAELCMKNRNELLDSIELHNVDSRRARYIDILVNGHPAEFKIDSGAEVLVVSPSFPGQPRVLDDVEGEVLGPGEQSACSWYL